MSNNTLKILYNSGTITRVYSRIIENTNHHWDFYADINSLTIPFKIEQVRRAILDAKRRGVGFRLITEITRAISLFVKM